mmetsp:Transcript_123485/g.394950  ORF Transcript_123485/g.394950 Transcript_123485/m.394950 type:complete len:253 (+) Transcript_123485:1290-2048(+)
MLVPLLAPDAGAEHRGRRGRADAGRAEGPHCLPDCAQDGIDVAGGVEAFSRRVWTLSARRGARARHVPGRGPLRVRGRGKEALATRHRPGRPHRRAPPRVRPPAAETCRQGHQRADAPERVAEGRGRGLVCSGQRGRSLPIVGPRWQWVLGFSRADDGALGPLRRPPRAEDAAHLRAIRHGQFRSVGHRRVAMLGSGSGQDVCRDLALALTPPLEPVHGLGVGGRARGVLQLRRDRNSNSFSQPVDDLGHRL